MADELFDDHPDEAAVPEEAPPPKKESLSPWRCLNRDCWSSRLERQFDYASATGVCPKCGEMGAALQKIHLVVLDKDGKLPGQQGNYRVVCKPQMHKVVDPITTDPSVANCPDCLENR